MPGLHQHIYAPLTYSTWHALSQPTVQVAAEDQGRGPASQQARQGRRALGALDQLPSLHCDGGRVDRADVVGPRVEEQMGVDNAEGTVPR